MTKLLTVITCTGFRKEAFKLCHSYMKRQTYKGPLQWIVINDEFSQVELDTVKHKYKDFELYAGPRRWEPGFNSHRGNMEFALSKIKGDYICFAEDDDYYTPTYLEHMVKLLDFADIAGEANAKYYNVQVPGWKEMHNYRHASLAQTGITSKLLPILKLAVDSGELYFDIKLWEQAHLNRAKSIIFNEQNLCIGMKGLPGRVGIGAGHRTKDFFIDPGLVKLRAWVGDDTENYLPYIRGNHDGRHTTNTPKPNPGRSAPGVSNPVSSKGGSNRPSSETGQLSAAELKGGTPVFLDATKAGRGAIIGQSRISGGGNISGHGEPQKR